MGSITPRAFSSLPLLSIYPGLWLRLAPLHQRPCNLIHAAYLSRSVFFHTLTNAHTLWPQKRLERWKGLPDKAFRRNLRGWLESFNSNKAGRKACLLLVIPHLLDKASQGSSAALNWCTYPYLYRSSLWLGERGNLTGLAAIQALMPICSSSFMAELAFSGAIFQAMRDMVFSFSLPLLMQLCGVTIAGSRYMFRRGATGASYTNHSGKATLPFACLWPVSPPVSTSGYLGERHQVIGLCSRNGNEMQIHSEWDLQWPRIFFVRLWRHWGEWMWKLRRLIFFSPQVAFPVSYSDSWFSYAKNLTIQHSALHREKWYSLLQDFPGKHFNGTHTIAYIVDCLYYELIAIRRSQFAITIWLWGRPQTRTTTQ